MNFTSFPMKYFFSLFLFIAFSSINAQVSVVNANINEYNISKSSLSQITVSNIGSSCVVKVKTTLRNSSNELLLTMTSLPVTLKQGVNIFTSSNLNYSQVVYSGSPQGNYLKNLHRLPSGAFNYCVTLIPISGLEEGDEYCQSVDASQDDQMYLVSPADEEVIFTPTPILLWMHTEPFNILSPGEFFRLTLVELNDNQTPADGVISNVPIFISNYVGKHQVPYPADAKTLEQGKRYGWIVQKISQGNVIASTEAWEFTLSKEVKPKDHMYVDLKKKLDGSIYKVQNDRIFFKYNERYESKTLDCKIYSDSREEIKTETINEQSDSEGAKSVGYNSFELDLSPYKLKTGYYTLEVLNFKKEKFLLKFYVEE